jgi:hypothetical protein
VYIRESKKFYNSYHSNKPQSPYANKLLGFVDNVLSDIVDPFFWLLFSHAFNSTFVDNSGVVLAAPGFLKIQSMPMFHNLKTRIVLSDKFWVDLK